MYLSAVFLILLLYVSYDIGSRTTFPGRKGHLRDDLENRFRSGQPSDSAPAGSISVDSIRQMADLDQYRSGTCVNR